MPHSTLREVPLDRAYRLMNHGPTVLVSAAHAGERNVMAAAWAMPLDFTPPKVAVVLDKATWTRELLEASGRFVLSIPTRSQADLVQTLGSTEGKGMRARSGHDKLDAHGVGTVPGRADAGPLIAGCVAWLECRLLPEPGMAERYDLFLGEVIAAQADSRVFQDGRWDFSQHDALRTLHHVAGGHYLVIGETVDAKTA